MGQAGHDLTRAEPVRRDIPRKRGLEDRRGGQRQLQTPAPRRAAVQVEEDVARRVWAADVIHDRVLGHLAIHGPIESEPVVQEAHFGPDLPRLGELGLESRVRPPEAVPVSAERCRLGFKRRPVGIRPGVLADFRVGGPDLAGHKPGDRREGVGENEAGRDGRVEKRVPLHRDGRRPVIPARDGQVPEVLVVEHALSEEAHHAALLERGSRRPQAGVVHGDEIRIHESRAYHGIRRRLVVGYGVAQQSADREVARDGVRVEAEHRLRVEVSGDDVRLVENTVVRGAGQASGIAQNEVLVGIGVGAEVGLKAPPRKRRRQEAEVDDDAIGLGVDLVLDDVVVRIIQLRRRRLGGDLAPGAEWREVILRVVGLGPDHQVDERAQVALVHLIVVVVGVGHREVAVQPGSDLGLRRSRYVDPLVA